MTSLVAPKLPLGPGSAFGSSLVNEITARRGMARLVLEDGSIIACPSKNHEFGDRSPRGWRKSTLQKGFADETFSASVTPYRFGTPDRRG
jgi:hypothetical protein